MIDTELPLDENDNPTVWVFISQLLVKNHFYSLTFIRPSTFLHLRLLRVNYWRLWFSWIN